MEKAFPPLPSHHVFQQFVAVQSFPARSSTLLVSDMYLDTQISAPGLWMPMKKFCSSELFRLFFFFFKLQGRIACNLPPHHDFKGDRESFPSRIAVKTFCHLFIFKGHCPLLEFFQPSYSCLSRQHLIPAQHWSPDTTKWHIFRHRIVSAFEWLNKNLLTFFSIRCFGCRQQLSVAS